jgi:D-tyrosyl-tRNA(Tyr) deacylase
MLLTAESTRAREDLAMRAVVTRVLEADVTVDGKIIGALPSPGLLVLLGVRHTDGAEQAAALAAKIWRLRILRDEQSAADIGAPLLVVSQFTLYADTRKGRRPSWSAAARSADAEPVYERFCLELEALGAVVGRGAFGADMAVRSVNDGPVTLLLEHD